MSLCCCISCCSVALTWSRNKVEVFILSRVSFTNVEIWSTKLLWFNNNYKVKLQDKYQNTYLAFRATSNVCWATPVLLATAVANLFTSWSGTNVLFISLANIWASSVLGVLMASVSHMVLFALHTTSVALTMIFCWTVTFSSNSCVLFTKLLTLSCQVK